ncbi:hypothetical protein PPTG_04544 [Phytophthora nicotianae INRA-310]|uniref:RXLR phytopathogen effector protein WY-domain domain-containing protein n=1 Tax=Phytophthora nicotianae (strain INRA-310) TaxID=761204 RepID=W2R3R2_PHYN3|nr:hypothetical protein PPTG_04544 [Phytophthora nicotianae INRA-310]ETN19150.1 hypothetical protein PPTG_04544 [Phytophthora nicotianae INRA-310]
MEEAQFLKWSKDGNSDEDLSKRLGLNKAGDKVFESPVFSTWVTWVTYLNKQNADPDLAMFSILRKRFGVEGLSNVVTSATKLESTSAKEIAEKLQLEIWRTNAKSSDGVFNRLKLNEKGDDILQSPALSTWVEYVLRLSSFKKDKFLPITELEKRFESEKLARMLASSISRSKEGVIDDLQELHFENWRALKIGSLKINVIFLGSNLANARVRSDFKTFASKNNVG